MNSRKPTTFILIHSLWMFPFLFLTLLAQEAQDGGVSNRNIEGLNSDDIEFILEQPLVYQVENVPYNGLEIDVDDAYDRDFYKKKHIVSNQELLKKRVESAISYREEGDIEQFITILKDVITRNNFNQEAAWAALLIGDFEFILYNLEEAMKYYIYAVNVHYQSEYGFGSMFKLAEVLDRNANWEKSEELLLLMLDYVGGDDLIKTRAENYLKGRYLEKVRWYYDLGEDDKVKEYFLKYQTINKKTEEVEKSEAAKSDSSEL